MLCVKRRGDGSAVRPVERLHSGLNRRPGCAVNLHLKQLPPRGEAALGLGRRDHNSLLRQPAGKTFAEVVALAVSETDAVVEVDATAAILVEPGRRIDADGQRTLRRFV